MENFPFQRGRLRDDRNGSRNDRPFPFVRRHACSGAGVIVSESHQAWAAKRA